MRVVSLLPSATEIVYLLGLGDQLAGVSHECDYPPAALGKPKVIRPAIEGLTLSSQEIDARVRAAFARGEGVYHIDLEALKTADPDLILTQEVCDVCAAPYAHVLEVVTKLSRKPEVLSLDPQRLGDVLRDVERGRLQGGLILPPGSILEASGQSGGEAGSLRRRNLACRVVWVYKWRHPKPESVILG